MVEYPYEKLAAWQLASDFEIKVARIARRFPSHEKYALTIQLVRAVRSIAANIAEGNSASGTGIYGRHLGIALGSLGEVDNHLQCARREGYLAESECEGLRREGWRIRGELLARLRTLRRNR